MAAPALIETGYSMDGIPDLIERWLKEDPTRTNKELSKLADVNDRTIGRWLNGESIPEQEEHLQGLARGLGLGVEAVKAAARESKRLRKFYQPREGVPPKRIIPETYVLTSEDKRRWREKVQKEESISDDARAVLRTFTTYFGDEDALEVFIDKEVLAEEWSNLSLELIERVWPEVVESRYVLRKRWPGSGWVFWLQFPDR